MRDPPAGLHCSGAIGYPCTFSKQPTHHTKTHTPSAGPFPCLSSTIDNVEPPLLHSHERQQPHRPSPALSSALHGRLQPPAPTPALSTHRRRRRLPPGPAASWTDPPRARVRCPSAQTWRKKAGARAPPAAARRCQAWAAAPAASQARVARRCRRCLHRHLASSRRGGPCRGRGRPARWEAAAARRLKSTGQHKRLRVLELITKRHQAGGKLASTR